MQPEFAGARITLAACPELGDSEGAAAESRAGMEIGKQKTSDSGGALCNKFVGAGFSTRRPGGRHFAISRAISSSPNYAAAHFELGVALRQQGKSEKRRRISKGRRTRSCLRLRLLERNSEQKLQMFWDKVHLSTENWSFY